MKQCRFCTNEIPYYGRDTCDRCLREMDAAERARSQAMLREHVREVREKKESDK